MDRGGKSDFRSPRYRVKALGGAFVRPGEYFPDSSLSDSSKSRQGVLHELQIM